MKSTDIGEYYKAHFDNLDVPCKCEECDTPLYKLKSTNIAHILPKSSFKSVALEYYNYLLLCFDCHNIYDSSFKRASSMRCFEKAKFRYELFQNDITEDHKILKFFK